MRRGLVLLCVCLAGCLSGDSIRPPPISPRTTLGPDGVLLDLVLVENALGDPFLNEQLWQNTDVQVAGLEKKGILDDNGFWVGQVIGMTPAELQKLITQERHCVINRRQLLPAGTPTVVALGPTLAECNFRLRTEDGADNVFLDQGQCTLTIMPSLTNDGRTRLKFTPQILYGSQTPDFQVASDGKGWIYQCKRPSKSYDALSWEVTLAPNQYLVIGTHFDASAPEDVPQSLGNQCFLQENGRIFTQRVLVIRTTRGKEAAKPTSAQPLATAAHCLQD